MFATHALPLPGAYVLRPLVQADARGIFAKLYHAPHFAALGLPFELAESYVTHSHAGVLRGLHRQTPPHAHTKLVSCIAGGVFDVLLDLRPDSTHYGQHTTLTLDAASGALVYIPPGIAHGFCTPDGPASLIYYVSSTHAPQHDSGVHWASAGINWPIAQPLVSARDAALPRLDEVVSMGTITPMIAP
jgi:dTDP-4-dehydrorhamnose 3,5-epimerase